MSDFEEKRYDFQPVIDAGTDYKWAMDMKDDAGNVLPGLTGATLTCIVKNRPGGTTLQDMSSYFVLTPATGHIEFTMTAAQTTALTWTTGFYKLRINLQSGEKHTLCYGIMEVDV